VVHVGLDGLVRGTARDRLLAELLDRRLDLAVDRRRLDDDVGGRLLAREGGLEAVVDLDDLQVLRERVHAGVHGLHPERG
jgi:hypothetical protein